MINSSSSISDENEKKPLYIHVKDFVKNYISDKNLQPGDPLPTEVEFVDMLNVSRTTLRNALDILQLNGLINKQQGRGTFVAKPSYEENLTSLSGFTEDVLRRGHSTSSIVLANQLIVPAKEMALELQISAKDSVFLLERLRMIDNEPVQISQSYLPKRYLKNLDLTTIDFTNKSLYKILIEAGISLFKGEEIVEASISDEMDCALLKIDENSPILVNRRKVYNDMNELIEMSYCRSRGDSHKVKILLRR
jgi:GntR family transcriptional regulator